MRAAPYLFDLYALSLLDAGALPRRSWRRPTSRSEPARAARQGPRGGALSRHRSIGQRFLIEQFGDVHGIYPRQDPLAREFVRRYAVGSSIETVGIATIFLSPVWVLAALGEATRAGKAIFSQIGEALKAERLLDPDGESET